LGSTSYKSNVREARPDIAWIKLHVPILAVAQALGLNIKGGRCPKIRCWRPANHRHGDADPSVSLSQSLNRVRCWVCDMKGGHSNLDLVMGVLDCDFASAVLWIADHFAVPNVKVGRPAGSSPSFSVPYRVGVRGSEWEVIVRSGMWGRMTAAERSILVALAEFADLETGLTRLSYQGIMRYSGVGMRGNVSVAIKELAKMHAIQIHQGVRTGITRECSSYRVTLDDPKFLDLCNAVYADARKEIAQEREFRGAQKARRQRDARKDLLKQEASTCEGLDLSSITEPRANKSVLQEHREIGTSPHTALEEGHR
jgi:hypothetical protein